MSSQSAVITHTTESCPANQGAVRPILSLAVCFAIVTGFVEAAGLLLFQRINWASWGQVEHVSLPIFWVSPILNCLLFVLLALGVVLICRIVPRLPAIPAVFFLLSALMFYDWLALPERLVHRSALILALGLAVALFRVFRKHETSVIRFSGRATPWLLVAVVLVWLVGAGWTRISERNATKNLPVAQAGVPNVIVVVVDTLRADHLSSYGYSRPTSPNLDRIAEQGVLFQNAIAASSWTLPSHASMLTGRYVYEHGAADVKSPPESTLDARYPTLPESFAQHGYRTGAFSGNFLYFSGNLGFDRGFLHFEDYFHSSLDAFSRTFYGREMSRLVLNHDRLRRLFVRLGLPGIDELQPSSKSSWMVRKRGEEVNREVLNWVDSDSTRPFFAFINYFDVHRSYTTPPGYARKFLHLSTHEVYLREVGPDDPKDKIDLYDDCVRYEDDQIGQLFDELKRRGLDQRTMVVITSDHGEMLGEHDLLAHRSSLYFPLIHVPLIFWDPGHIPAGARIQQTVSNISLAATISDVLGQPGGESFPGPSLKPLWSDPQPITDWPHPLSELSRFKDEAVKFPSRYGAMTSVITPQYHYIFHTKFGKELYDWPQDPAENDNLAKTPAGAPATQTLAEEIQTRMSHPQ